jgi:hypothetical protein
VSQKKKNARGGEVVLASVKTKLSVCKRKHLMNISKSLSG